VFVKNKSIDPTSFIQEIFGFLEGTSIELQANFKKLTTWNSLNALIIHHKIEEKYGISLDYEVFNKLETIEDLYLTIEKKMRNAS